MRQRFHGAHPRLCYLLHVLLIVWALAAFSQAACAQAPEPPAEAATALEAQRTELDEVEATVSREDVGADALAELRGKLNGVSDALRAKIAELEPRTAEVEARLKELGPAPAAGAAPEAPELAEEREQLTGSFAELDGALKQARLLAVRTDQLSERVSERRHALYASELFARNASILDPYFWIEAGKAVPVEAGRLVAVLRYWRNTTWAEAGPLRLLAAGALILGLALAVAALARWWLPRFHADPRTDTRARKARAALLAFLWYAGRAPLAFFAAVLGLEALGLLSMRLAGIADGVVAAVFAAAFGKGVARALFAPGHPERRLLDFEERTALVLHNHIVWLSRTLAAAVFLQVLHKTLHAPLIITVATNALFAAAITAFLISLIVYVRRNNGALADADAPRLGVPAAVPGAYPIALLVAALLLGALVAGYAAAAAFLALRVVVAAVVFGALYILLAATRALFEGFGDDTRRGRALAVNLGVSPRSLGLIGTLFSAAIRVLLIVFACLLIIGPWEVSTADLFDTVRNIPFGFKVGEINVSLRAVLAAAVALVFLLAVTRVGQRWLETEVLPRTALEPSLRMSIGTIFGYLGVIAAIGVAMASLGIDLGKIAIVAGALSVGIGFGLQSVVSNFVSGIILLAERPIRVGDSIIVKGEEGWVRRVRVRATEIETPDRASVIIPNSEFITGIVKNRTHANTLGRVTVKLGVSYDSDAEQVRDTLRAIAKEHPQVVQAPPPAVLFTGFGDSALTFEMHCVVADVEAGGGVRSDLHYAILKRFRALGIEMPYPQQEVRLRRPDGEPAAQAAIVPLGRAGGNAGGGA